MKTSRRTLLKGFGGTLALPLLESTGLAAIGKPPVRFLVVGNPFGAHPDHFFPTDFGKNFTLSETLSPLSWLKDRLTILSHTDHNMVSGHGREVSFLSGVLPANAAAYPEKNMSIDQLMARHSATQVRYASVEAGLGAGVRMNWTANGVEKAPITSTEKLYDHLFLNLTNEERANRNNLLNRNLSILDTVNDQFAPILKNASQSDKERLDQFQTSVRELETTFNGQKGWIDKDKPKYDLEQHYADSEITIHHHYQAIFDMISYAFQTDLTRVASIAFPSTLSVTQLDGVNRSYHGCTHNGKMEDVTAELVAIETFQIHMLSDCLKKLDTIQEPGTEGSMLDNTIVLFGSGMGYGGTHSNRKLPILVAGGGFDHLGHVDARNKSGENMPLCNLFVTLLNRFGLQRDSFNTSTSHFDLKWS